MSLWKDKGRGDWRYRFQAQKKTYAGGGFATKAEARAAREDRRKAVNSKPQTPTPMVFSEVATEYLKWSERRHVHKTFDNKRMVFRNFIEHSGDLAFETITSFILNQYLSTRRTNQNYNAHRKQLCALFAWAIKHLGLSIISPCLQLEKLPEEKAKKKIPTPEEYVRILLAAKPDEKILLTILSHTMARIDEILRMKWEDVNFTRGELTLWTRKRRDGNWEPRIIPMTNTLSDTLKSLHNRREQDEWVFFNKLRENRFVRLQRTMSRICKRAGIPVYGFHTLRHFSATFMFDAGGVSTGVIGSILGHKDKRTTEIYLHSVDESLREAVKKLDFMLADLACRFDEKPG